MSTWSQLAFSKNILFLYFHRALSQAGKAMLGVFLPIYLYEQFNLSLAAVVVVFVAIFTFYTLLLPLGGKIMTRLGSKTSIIIAIPISLLALVSLIALPRSPIFIISFIVFDIISRLLYWVPYHVDFASFTDPKNRGKQIAVLQSISYIILAVSPVIAGGVLLLSGFKALLVVVIILYIFSVFPLFYIDPIHEKYQFGYIQSFRKLFARENRSLLTGFSGEGMQAVIGLVIWPIFIYSILQARYAAIGLVTSLTIVFVIIFSLIVGYLSDKWSKKRMLLISSIVYTTGWILKIFIETGSQIFMVDSYHKLGHAVNKTSFDVIAYDQAADSNHYIDEFTVLKEMAHNGARVLALVIALGLAMLFGIRAVFLLGAAAALLMILLTRTPAQVR